MIQVRTLEDVDEAVGDFGVDALDAGVVVCIEGSESHDKIGFRGIDAVCFDNLRIGSKMIRMQIRQLVI